MYPAARFVGGGERKISMRKINPQRVFDTPCKHSGLTRSDSFRPEGLLSVSTCMDTDFRQEMAEDVLSGMTGSVKSIPCKYLYDAYGSRLFDRICTLPEYYPTRTELEILDRNAHLIMEFFTEGEGSLIEIGSGSDLKIRSLLKGLNREGAWHVRYVPVDICETSLLRSAHRLLDDFPWLCIHALVADFTRHINHLQDGRKLIAFLGGTFGNFTHEQGVALLKGFAGIMNGRDRMLLGIDMLKPPGIIEAAYNDQSGVTAEFNRNILRHVNHRLRADFRLDDFEHLAFFDPDREQVEMHLRARSRISAHIAEAGLCVSLEPGETILTEISRKFSRMRAMDCFDQAGLVPVRWFTDANAWFSLVELAVRAG